MKMSKLMRFAAHTSVAALLLTGMALLPGCGGSKEEAKPAAQPASSEGSAKVESKAAEVAKEIAAAKDALSLLPESADLALNIPPVNAVLKEVLPFIDGFVADVDLEYELERVVSDLARDLNVSDANTLGDIATAKGLNFDESIAVFADLTPSMESAKEAIEGGSAVDTSDLGLPNLAIVANVLDGEKVADFLTDLMENRLYVGASDDVDADGITIKTFDDGHAFFIAGDKVAISNNIDFLKEVAARTANPAKLRYGSAAMPKANDNEAALLIFGANLHKDVKEVLPALQLDAGMDALLKYQMQTIDATYGSGSNDPIVTTLSWDDSKIELKSRVDIKEHPGILEMSGPAGDLRLAQMLPEGTQALLSIRFTDELKKQIKEMYLPMIADATGNAQVSGFGPQVIEMLGDELTLGITGAENDFPQIFLMISVQEAAANMLKMFIPQMEDQEHNGVMISTIAAPVPVPLSIAYPSGMVVVSNGVEGIKGIIDHASAGTSSEFFAKLNLDPATPRYSGLIINTDLISSLMPLAALTGGVPREAEDVLNPLTEALQELRVLSEINGDFAETSLRLSLK